MPLHMSSEIPIRTAHSDWGRPQSMTCKEHVHKILSITSPSQPDRWLLPPFSLWPLKQCWGAGPWVSYRGEANMFSQWKLIRRSPPKLPGRFRLQSHTIRGMRIHHKDKFQKISQASLLSSYSCRNPPLFVRHHAKWLKYIILSNYKILKERHCYLSFIEEERVTQKG